MFSILFLYFFSSHPLSFSLGRAQKAAPAAARPPKRREPKTLPDGTRKPNPYKVEKKRRLPAVPEVVLNRRRDRRAHKKKSLALKLKVGVVISLRSSGTDMCPTVFNPVGV